MKQRVSPLGALIVGFLAFSASPVELVAQDASALVEEARGLYARDREPEALAKLEQALALNPSSEEALSLQNQLEYREWVRIMRRDGRHLAAVTRLFEMAKPAAAEKRSDPGTIRELIDTASGDDWNAAEKAMRQLAADHGPYATAQLTSLLGHPEPLERAQGIEIARRIGVDSVLPMIAFLNTEEEMARATALTTLGQIGDGRAYPYVLAARGQGGFIGRTAEMALKDLRERMPADHKRAFGNVNDAVRAHLILAELYSDRSEAVVDPVRGTYVVWALEGGDLVGRELPRDVFHLKLAEQVLYDTLAVAPANMEAHVALGTVLCGQAVAAAAYEEGSAPTQLAKAAEMAAALGSPVMEGVLRNALDKSDPDVGAMAAHLLARLLDGQSSGSAALSAGLGSRMNAVRFQSALSLAALGNHEAAVVTALGDALKQDVKRTVVIIDDVASTRDRLVSDLGAQGWFAYGSRSSAHGLADLRSLPIEDAAIIRFDLRDGIMNTFLRVIEGQDSLSKVRVFILAEPADMDRARELYGDRAPVSGFLSTKSPVSEYEAPLMAAVDELSDASREAATAQAAQAAQALTHVPASEARAALQHLMGTLEGGRDSVRIPAMHALARIGDKSAVPALTSVLGKSLNSEEVRGAAAIALGACLSRTGSVPTEVDEMFRATLQGEGSAAFLGQVGIGIGRAPYSAQQRAALMSALRERITIDLDS